MAKDVTIMKNKVLQTFTAVKKIRTNLVGEGTQNWIPEDEAADYAKIKKGSFNENGTYYAADDDKDAYNEIKVRVPSERLKLKALKVTENGVYSAEDQNIDAFNSVSVKVEGGGTGGADYTYKWEQVMAAGYGGYPRLIEYNNAVYALHTDNNVYAFNGSTWSLYATSPVSYNNSILCGYNGALCILNGSNMYTYNGTSFVLTSTVPITTYGCNAIEYGGALHLIGGANHYIYNGSWSQATGIQSGANNPILCIYEEAIYAVTGSKTYVWGGNSWTDVGNNPFGAISAETAGVENNNNKTKIHISGGDHYSYNGNLWRPEEKAPNNGQIIGLSGEIYSIALGSTYKATLITAEIEEAG